MRLLQPLSEMALGRALLAYAFDLPRWTLANILFAVALLPAYLALTQEQVLAVGVATLPTVLVLAGMINMAARQIAANAPRFKDAFAYPATLHTVFIVWAGAVVGGMLLLVSTSLVVVFAVGILVFSFLMIGVFALFMPSQLNVGGALIWRNALVLAVSNPIVALGLVVLGLIGVWAVAISKGALVIVVPSLWVLLVAFTVDDRIKAMQASQQQGVTNETVHTKSGDSR